MKTKPKSKIIFEYDCYCFFGTSYKYTLFADGRFIKAITFSTSITEFPKDKGASPEEEIITSLPLVSAVEKVIEENKEELKLLPKEMSNFNILDGAEETIKFGSLKFTGCNILTESLTEAKKWYKQNNQEVPDWVEDIMKFQKIFRKVQKAINEFVKVRLVE